MQRAVHPAIGSTLRIKLFQVGAASSIDLVPNVPAYGPICGSRCNFRCKEVVVIWRDSRSARAATDSVRDHDIDLIGLQERGSRCSRRWNDDGKLLRVNSRSITLMDAAAESEPLDFTGSR